jgi:hypothetical protein
MLGSIIEESPALAGILGAIVLALAILVGGAMVSHIVDWRRRPSARDQRIMDQGETAPPDDRSERSRRGFGRARAGFGPGGLTVAFLVGLVAGGAGVVLSSRDVATAVATLTDLFRSPPGAAVASAGDAGGSDGPLEEAGQAGSGDWVAPSTAGPGTVRDKLAGFAERLKASLPRAAGPELSLTSVELNGMTLNLGYAVGRVMGEDETAAFEDYIMRTVRSLFCGAGSQEIRFLSENGVVFRMHYVDPRGAPITDLTVAPGFCA